MKWFPEWGQQSFLFVVILFPWLSVCVWSKVQWAEIKVWELQVWPLTLNWSCYGRPSHHWSDVLTHLLPLPRLLRLKKKKNTSPTLEEKKALFYVSVSGWGDSALPPCLAEGVGEAEKHVYLSAQLQFDLESTSCNCHTSELATWQISKTTMFVLVLFFLLIFPLRFIPSISFTLRSDEPWWKAAWHLKRLWSF